MADEPGRLDYLRCLCCGKLAPRRVFDGAAKGRYTKDHEPLLLDGKTQVSRSIPGVKRGGFDWFDREVTAEERAFMARTLRTIANRLSAQLIEDVLTRTSDDDLFAALCVDYVREGQLELAARKVLIEAIKEQRFEDE